MKANFAPIFIFAASFIPICVLMTMNITTSMTRFSQMYNSKVDVYKAEKRKTEKLLSSLLPTSVIRKLKKGKFYIPKSIILALFKDKCPSPRCLRVSLSSSVTLSASPLFVLTALRIKSLSFSMISIICLMKELITLMCTRLVEKESIKRHCMNFEGWNDWWCVHGCFWNTCSQWTSSCCGALQDGSGSLGQGSHLWDQAQAAAQTEAEDGDAQWAGGGGSGGLQDPSLLCVWWHCGAGLADGEQWHAHEDSDNSSNQGNIVLLESRDKF